MNTSNLQLQALVQQLKTTWIREGMERAAEICELYATTEASSLACTIRGAKSAVQGH